MVNLTVKIGNLTLKNPVMAASGTFGADYRRLIDVGSLGAIVTKTITLKGRVGNPPPRVAETASGMLNSIGLENKGLADFVKNKIPAFPAGKTALIVSIAGDSEGELKELAGTLKNMKIVSALEINLSCPNIKHGSREGLIAQDAEATHSMVRAVRSVTRLPIIAKLTPNVTDISKIAIAAEKGGADAVLIANTFPAMAVDIGTRKPRLGNITGGLSGPAIKPIILKMVWDVYNKVKIPVIGCGGIMDYKDVIEFMLCGARAIQVGTATFVNPKAPVEIIAGIRKYCAASNVNDIKKLIGNMKTGAL